MNSSPLTSVLFLVFFSNAPAWAVHKCTDANGHISFQQSPCSGSARSEQLDVHPASGPSPEAQPSSASASGTPSSPLSETDRLNALQGRLAKENRLSDLDNLHLPAAQGEIIRAQQRCESELGKLRERKALANRTPADNALPSNNLAGAIWEQSLSTEMQATAALCETEQRRLHGNLERYLAERRDLERDLAKP